MDISTFDSDRDRESVLRAWVEAGWLDQSNEVQLAGANAVIDAGRAWVSHIDGDAECMVLCCDGHIRYLDEDVPFSGVTGVITSRVARKQGLAGRLTAHAVAQEAKAGALVSGLGMFEQGFYNRIGFGSGQYEDHIGFDPTLLNVPFPKRAAKRFTRDDYARMHTSRLRAKKEHGFITFPHEKMTLVDQANTTNGFGLGFVDESTNEIQHHVWCSIADAENGPYHIRWMAYRSPEEFLELMGVIRSLGDQVRLMTMIEPPNIQIQDLLSEPIQNRHTTRGSKLATFSHSLAWWQTRIVDLPGCLAHTHLHGPTTQFNLELTDPIEDFLTDDESWRGISGEYIVTLGEESGAAPGTRPDLPTMKTTVGAFTRMWFGNVRPTGLPYTETIEAPQDLLEALDRSLSLPKPGHDWDF